MVDVVKRIPGRKFDSKLNMWVIPKSFYPPGKYTQKAYVDIFANWAVKKAMRKAYKKELRLQDRTFTIRFLRCRNYFHRMG